MKEKIYYYHELINEEILLFWRKILKPTNRLRILIENPATAVFVNTVAFFGLWLIFGDFFYWLALANILIYLYKIIIE